MGLISKEVEMKWHPNNKEWYEDKGYVFANYGDQFEVKIEDLSKGSTALVQVQCDSCGEIVEVNWTNYKSHNLEYGYYCKACVNVLMRKSKLTNGKSFKQWCIENNRQDFLDRWDYELNDCSPEDVNCHSSGLNGKKGYWFKCSKNPNHVSELKSINSLAQGKQKNIDCHQCNSIKETNKELIKYFINKEDACNYSHGSSKSVAMKCPDCGYEKNLKIDSLSLRGFCCPKCSDKGFSYPEKFLFGVFEQLLNKNFQTQLSKRIFEWCKNYRYDFYIPEINCITETHGRQHYEVRNGCNWDSLEKIQENDKQKEQLAKENDIKHYIIIDCRESTLEWIKSSIMNSKLSTLLNFKEDDIDWLKCHEIGCRNLVKVVCDLWNNGMKNIKSIENELRIEKTTVVKYLKQGEKLDWCNYDPKEEMKKK